MPKNEYLLYLNVVIEGPRKLTEADIYKIFAIMTTELDEQSNEEFYGKLQAEY